MSIHYDFYKTDGLKGVERDLMVRPVSHKTTTTAELAEDIEHATTASTSDIRLVLDALSHAVVEELLDGNRVHIDGLGYFSLSITGDIRRDQKGRLKLHDAAVRKILFQPEKAILRKFSTAEFTSKYHKGRNSRITSEADIKATLSTLSGGLFFTVGDYASRLGLTRPTAYRQLLRLEKEGRVENIGSRGQKLYRVVK